MLMADIDAWVATLVVGRFRPTCPLSPLALPGLPLLTLAAPVLSGAGRRVSLGVLGLRLCGDSPVLTGAPASRKVRGRLRQVADPMAWLSPPPV